MRSIDLNCDMGEGGGNDAELMKYISSTNIACGFHAGDRSTMRRTIRLALENKVAIGAHPGYRDHENFGRLPRSVTPSDVFNLVVEQIEELDDLCNESHAELHHVKPHGALYNQAAKDVEIAAAISEAVAQVNRGLILYGLSGSCLISEAAATGLKTASEVFADRTYRADGSLTPRTDANALITNVEYSVRQVVQMVASGKVTSVTGEPVSIQAETICLHGDAADASGFAIRLREKLDEFGISVRSM